MKAACAVYDATSSAPTDGPSAFPLSVAPMIQWTDRNWRYMMRSITRKTLLYSEMIPADAIVYANGRGEIEDFIGYSRGVEEPLALQLGGSDVHFVSEAAKIAESVGHFEEINLNCGCPSNKAKKCGYGAELMLDPDLVQQLLRATARKVSHTSLSVKCRLGLDRYGYNEWKDLVKFVTSVRDASVRKMVIHSRVCVLNGLSCAQNRTIPPLRHEVCHKLVKEFPDMHFVINGGIDSFDEALYHLGKTDTFSKFDRKILKNMKIYDSVASSVENSFLPSAATTDCSATTDVGTSKISSTAEEVNGNVFGIKSDDSVVDDEASLNITSDGGRSRSDGNETHYEAEVYFDDSMSLLREHPVHGVMIGREVYHNPFILADADEIFFGTANQQLPRREILDDYFDYCDRAQDSDAFGSNICTLLKPLHNFFHGAPSNTSFKRKLDEITKQMSRKPAVRVSDIVEAAIDGTISAEILASWRRLD